MDPYQGKGGLSFLAPVADPKAKASRAEAAGSLGYTLGFGTRV